MSDFSKDPTIRAVQKVLVSQTWRRKSQMLAAILAIGKIVGLEETE